MSLAEKAKLFGKEWQAMSKQDKDDFYQKASIDQEYLKDAEPDA